MNPPLRDTYPENTKNQYVFGSTFGGQGDEALKSGDGLERVEKL
jgi:hypothetical protein